MSEIIQNYVPDKPYKFTLYQRTIEPVIDFVRNIKYSVKQFFRNVIRVFRWIPLIWNDRDWDSSYLYKILQFKLRSVQKDAENWHYIGADKQRLYLQQALDDLEIILSDDSECTVSAERALFNEKYGQIKTWSTPVDGNEKLFQMHFAYEKCTDEQMVKQADEQSTWLFTLAASRDLEVRNRFWNNLKANADRWWD